MASAIQGNAVSYWAVEQASVSSGVPATPVWSNLRRTSGDIDITKSFTQSDEVDVTRQAGYNVITGSEVSGSMDRELSVADPAFQLVVKGALQAPELGVISTSAVATTFDNGTANILQIGAFGTAIVGQYIACFGSALNNRVFRVTDVLNADNVTVSPAPVDETISTSISGKSFRNSNQAVGLAVQKRIPTDGLELFKTFEGCQIGALNLAVGTGSIVTLTYDVTGLGKTADNLQIAGSSDDPIDGSRVSGTVKDVMEFWIDGLPVSPEDVCYTDFSLSLDNGTAGNPAIGKEGSCVISHGAGLVTGSLVSYVDGTNETTADAEIQKRDNETLFQLGITFKDVDGNYLVVSMPSAQYTELTQADTANGDILMNTGTISATGKPEGYALEFNFISAP